MSFFPLVAERCWRTLGHSHFAAGEVVTGVLLLIPHLKKKKESTEGQKKGKILESLRSEASLHISYFTS